MKNDGTTSDDRKAVYAIVGVVALWAAVWASGLGGQLARQGETDPPPPNPHPTYQEYQEPLFEDDQCCGGYGTW